MFRKVNRSKRMIWTKKKSPCFMWDMSDITTL